MLTARPHALSVKDLMRGPSDAAVGNYVNGESDLSARADFIEKVRQSLLPPNGEPSNRILLGQVLKSSPLVGEALLYRAPNSKSADLTGRNLHFHL